MTTATSKNNINNNENDSSPIVLKVSHLSKSFRLPTEQATGMKQAFINWTRGIKGYKEQQVLKDISFEVHRGDFYGIVGRNGSGKSTLLKLISGIYTPGTGSIEVSGKLVPFIELGVGFNPELTGRENVYLNGALLGFSRDEIDKMYNGIVDFAELEEFMDQKLKNYSSGMQVRLAFSIAIKAQGDILVLDEVLAVGDEAFQRKCNDFFEDIKKDKSKTVILVTHSMASVKRYCNKALLIKDGEVLVNGDKDNAANLYTQENLQQATETSEEGEDGYPIGLNARVPHLRISPVSKTVLSNTDTFVFDVDYEFNESIPFYIAYSLFDMQRGGIAYDSGSLPINEPGHHRVRCSVPLDLFTDTDFKILVSLREDNPNTASKDTDLVAFTNDSNSGYFSLRNGGDDRNYALIEIDALETRYEVLADPLPPKNE